MEKKNIIEYPYHLNTLREQALVNRDLCWKYMRDGAN